MSGLPLVLDLVDRPCICVGGGAVSARRLPSLLAAGARLTVISPSLDPEVRRLVEAGKCRYLARTFAPGDVTGAFLVLANTGVHDVDMAVAAEALGSGALTCVAGAPVFGNCQFMATIRRGALLVAWQGGGAAPAVTVALRARLEQALPEDLGATLDGFAALRQELRRTVPDPGERGRRWQQVVRNGLIEAALAGQGAQALEQARMLLVPDAPEEVH